ncbi:CzcE family metal-binding protein [Duganella callida]|uniref:CzcE family metal-binding protein n=1 Tax=Duganella callida TaxID=2561932 RepID=A0A4Y9SAV1_9BURK|nr:CzcE family metal-binding protein [Duganella callida]TFW17711.1 CzcE family metal-binding protein [Duganella callida]
MSIIKRATLAAAFSGLTSLLTASAHAAPTAADYGNQVADGNAMRTIVVNADTKYVNVANGETVQFDVNGQRFTWHFDTLHDATSLDLGKIAPAGVMAGQVRAYVAANPLYRG